MLKNVSYILVACASLIGAAGALPSTLVSQTLEQSAVSEAPSEHVAVAPVASEAGPTAIASSEYARSPLGANYGLRTGPGAFHGSASSTSTPQYIVGLTDVADAPEGPHGGLGSDLALTVVGAVGTFAGIKIGGGVGGTIAVASAAVALYGLYRFFK